MANPKTDLKNILELINARIGTGDDFEIVIVHKQVGAEDKMVSLKKKDLKKMRMALLEVDEQTGTFSEKKATQPLDTHIRMGDKLAIAIKVLGGTYYLCHPVEFSNFKNKATDSLTLVLRSFKVFLTR